MADICYLRKSVDNRYFLSDEYSENYVPIGEDVVALAAAYPFHKFIVVNDDTDYGIHNIISRKDVLRACGVDGSLTIPCSGCDSRLAYTKSQCGNCGTQNDRCEICRHVLGHDYKKAMAKEKMDTFFGKGATLPGSGFGKVSLPYRDLRVQYDPLLKLLSQGCERVVL